MFDEVMDILNKHNVPDENQKILQEICAVHLQEKTKAVEAAHEQSAGLIKRMASNFEGLLANFLGLYSVYEKNIRDDFELETWRKCADEREEQFKRFTGRYFNKKEVPDNNELL